MENKKLHILFLCSWYPNPDSKSNGIFIKRHAQALALQHQVTVVFVKSIHDITKPYTSTTQHENLVEHCLFYPKTNSPIPLLSSVLKLLKFKATYKKLIDQFSHPFDIIHVNTIFPAAIPALYAIKKYPKAKLFITEHWSGYYPEDGNYKGFLLKYYTKKIVSKATSIFVISEKLKQAMLSHQLKGNYHLINNVVDTSVFKPNPSELPSSPALRILHVSSLVDREKNISGIIEIAYELKKKNKVFQLTIVGENSIEIERYQESIKAKSLHNEINFVGYKSPQEIANYMNTSDVFLLFSHFEGMPVVLLESLACGLPVITTSVGEVKNMVQSAMGIVLNSHKVEECVENLLNFNRTHFCPKEEMHDFINQYYSAESVCNSFTYIFNKELA